VILVVAFYFVPNFNRGSDRPAIHSDVTPAKAGVHRHKPLECGPRLSPGRQPEVQCPKLCSLFDAE